MLKYNVLKCRENGFTLIEILIAVAIIALIASVAVPSLGNRLNKAKIEVDKTNVRLLQSTVDVYYQNHGVYPVNSADPADNAFYALDRDHDLVVKGYLREIPASPFKLEPGYRRDGKTVKSLAEGTYY